MAKFVIDLEEAIVAIRKHFGLPESVQVEIEFDTTAHVKSDDGWQEVPKCWTLSSPPGEVDYNDRVEVLLRDETIRLGRAGDFSSCWAQDGHRYEIIKYRRV